jgi:hypothetical protein
MGDTLAVLLLLALTIGLAVPLVPFAAGLARRTVRGWKDAVLVAALTGALLYVSFAPASLLGAALAYAIFMVLVAPLLWLVGSNIGQGAISFLFAWVGAWAVGVLCAACLATSYLNDWWNGRPH